MFFLLEKKGKRLAVARCGAHVLTHSPLYLVCLTSRHHVSESRWWWCGGGLFTSPLCLGWLFSFDTTSQRPMLLPAVSTCSPHLNRQRGRAYALRSCFLSAVFKDWSLRMHRYFKAGSEAQGDEALDLGLISSILLPTELTTNITLESTAHYCLCTGTSVFTWFKSSSQRVSQLSLLMSF